MSDREDDERDVLGWHVIPGSLLLEYLRRARNEDPDLLFMELWANADHDHVEP